MNTDHAAAVIEAARKVRRKYVHMEIVANRETGEAWLDVIVTTAFKTYLSATFPESTDPLPDTFVADLTDLCIAIDAYDEAESHDNLTCD